MSTNQSYPRALCLLVLCIYLSSSIRGQFSAMAFGDCHLQSNPGYAKTMASHKSTKNNYDVQHDTIAIYFEIDYALFQLMNSSVEASNAYLDQLFSNIQEIYTSEGITLAISDRKIWDTPDPYANRSARHALLSFVEQVGTEYEGHLAHLLSGNPNQNGGLAYLSGFCDRSISFAYSNVFGEVGTLDSYSWDTHVVAHEIGHNLGAPHTNECLWGPNNDKAIDGCGQTNPSCSIAPVPSSGGTIMSSCHSNPAGVNLRSGLGAEPAAVIRSIIATCYPAEGGNCYNPIVIDDDGTYTYDNITLGYGALQESAIHSMWYLYKAKHSGFLSIGSCGQEVDTRLNLYRGQCSSLILEDSSDDHCESGQGFLFASSIDSMQVSSGDSIWIEWDDRWTSDGLTWTLTFDRLESETCYNGILDEGGDQIDCGQNCLPCSNPCSGLESLQMDHDGVYYSDTTLMINRSLDAHTHISLSSPQGVLFDPGSSISIGASIAVYLEDCSSYQSRLNNN